MKIKLKALHFADVAEIQVAVTDELKKVQTRTFMQLFRSCTTAQKPIHTSINLLKKLSSKLLDRTVSEQQFIRQHSSANSKPSYDSK
jgi:hypothetical protein